MRLTSIHVANALTFDDITVPLETEGPTVFVGPNGSGKTNLFRVVEQLLKILPEGMGPHTNGLTDSLSTLAGWQRDLGSPTVLEVGIQWTEDEEISLFATFIGLSLSDHHPFSRELNIPTGFEQRPTWERFTGTLANMVKVQSATFLATGVLGLRYQAPGSFHLYYQMLAGESLTWILPPQGSDVTLTVPDDLLRSQRTHSVALSQMWLRSLPDEERARLGSFLDQGDDTTPVPQLSFSLSDALQQAVLDTGQSPVPARAMVRVAIDSSFRGQEAVRSLERQVLSGQDQTGRNMTLTDVLCYLLSGRIVVSDDLLSAPEEQYTINTWLRDAKPLSSRHLGAYLADLKDGNDADRRRFAEIQRTFADLSRGRDLDVTRIRPRDTSEEVVIRVVQRAHGDRLSTPVVTSGSGLVELAYLATILNLPRCHVALLDEPGRSLHPQALLALRHHLYHQRKSGDTDSSSQSVVITHSPYLVPTTALQRVRRVSRDTGAKGVTTVSRLENHDQGGLDGDAATLRQDLQMQDRWGRSPNWPSLLFSAVVLLVEGETELGALPIWYERRHQQPLEALGISILCVNGKQQVGEAIRDLIAFSVPCVTLVDGDSLKKGKGNGGNVWDELVEAGFISTTQEAQSFKRRDPSDQIDILRTDFAVYVCGQEADKKFETVLTSSFPDAVPPSDLSDSKVLRGRWYAQTYPCPAFVKPLFDKVREVAAGGLSRI